MLLNGNITLKITVFREIHCTYTTMDASNGNIKSGQNAFANLNEFAFKEVLNSDISRKVGNFTR